MVVKMFLINALVDGLFSGGKTGVVILRHLGQEVFLQALAAELGLPVTAYVMPHNEAFMVRYFTPRQEVEMADYAALATAQALFGAGLAPVTRPVTLLGRGGRHQVACDPLDPARLALTLEAPIPGALGPEAEQLIKAMGLDGRGPAEVLAVGDKEAAVCYQEPDALHRAASHLPFREALGFRRPGWALTLSAPLAAETGQTGYAVCSWNAEGERQEVPVNLGVHAHLAPFWAERLGGRQLTVHHLAERTCLMRADLTENSRTSISGLLTTILKADPVLSELTGELPPDLAAF